MMQYYVGKRRVALVGYGYWGERLLRNFANSSRFVVQGVVEKNPQARQRCQDAYPNLQMFDSIEALRAKTTIDCAVIATPPPTHADLANQLLDAGCDLLVEKPFTLSLESARSLLQKASSLNRKIMVDHTFVYHPVVQHVRSEIVKGELGDLLYYDSLRTNFGGYQPETNVLWDLGPHDISILDYWLGGKLPANVSVIGRKFCGSPVENVCHMTLTYPDGFLAHISMSWLAPTKIRTTVLGGTKQMLVYDDNLSGEKLKIYDRSFTPTEDRRQSYRIGGMMAPAIQEREALAQLVNSFSDYINGAGTSSSDGIAGARIVSILESASESLIADGKPIQVKAIQETKEKKAA